MTIENDNCKEIDIKDLRCGEAFLCDGELHIKFDEQLCAQLKIDYLNAALNLDTSKKNRFVNGTKVIPVKAKVTYEYI